MECREVTNYLYQFIDQELEEAIVRLIEEHLSQCPLCSSLVDKEKKFDCFIRAHFPREEASDKLKQSIVNMFKGG